MSWFEYRGVLGGHKSWVTALSAGWEGPDLVSASRDKTVVAWTVDRSKKGGDLKAAKKVMTGHSDAVQDVKVSPDGKHALSCSWDRTMRLWDLSSGETVNTLTGHTDEVLSAAFSPDGSRIASASRDKSIRVWDTAGKVPTSTTIGDEKQHTDWVTSVRFSPDQKCLVSVGWDRLVKVWDLPHHTLRCNLEGHTSLVNALDVSPDGSLAASGGKDGVVILWNLGDKTKMNTFEVGSSVNAVCFCPSRFWLCAASDKSVRVFDMERHTLLEEFRPLTHDAAVFTSLAWSADCKLLFVGSSDHNIHVYGLIDKD